MRTVVLSDIHGNAHALTAALAEAARQAPDRLVVLGDLCTYGPATDAILSALADAAQRWPITWVKGNHEEIYEDLDAGRTAYVDGLAPWLRESIAHTFAHLDVRAVSALPWSDELEDGHILFAHANPWRDWRYLNGVDAQRDASATLQQRGFAVGVFGHTHRSRLFHLPSETGGDDDHPLQRTIAWGASESLVINAGSIGQPRNRRQVSTMAVLDADDQGLSARIVELDYDVRGHLDALAKLPLSVEARRRLSAYFTPR